MTNPDSKTLLDVSVKYDKTCELITTTFEQEGQIITIGFNIGEAQLFNIQLAEAITTAIFDVNGISETKH